jgi:N-acyl amino acid synthase of PEP-CTERM/exosortase system
MDSSVIVATSATRTNAADVLSRFNTYFLASPADTPELIEMAFALRYQVYCLERKFEDPKEHADHLERDEFDRRALHSLIFHRLRAEAIGTVRLILPEPRPDSLPIQQLLRKNGLDSSDYFQSERTAEISRFAISKEFRRRSLTEPFGATRQTETERRSNLPCLGLIQSILRQSLELGISSWTAVMEPQLLRMLASMGIQFMPIGPLVNHHGLRQPSFCDVPQMLKALEYQKPEYWAVVTNDGELIYREETLVQRKYVA